MKWLKNAALNAYASFWRRIFLLPGPQLNLFCHTLHTLFEPFLKNRNYWRRMDEALTRAATKDHPYVDLVHHIANCNDNAWRSFAIGFLLHRLTFGVSKTITNIGRERRLEKEGIWWPSVIAFSVTSECNLHCKKCYAEDRFEPCELEFSVIEQIVTEGESMGTFMYNVVGGEPLLKAEELWGLFRRHPNSCFVVFTNGTLLDQRVAEMVAEVGNVVISVSIDGFDETTNDARRGEGVFRKVIEALDLLAAVKAPIAVYTTVSKQNYSEVISDGFIKMLLGHGVMAITLGEFVPAGGEPDPEWDLDNQQRMFLRGFWMEHLRATYPLWVRHGRPAVEEVSVCDAARRHIHITPSGAVEPCVFCPASVDNIHDVSIREAMNSGFFNRVRALNGPAGANCSGITKPCMMYRDPQVARQIESLKEGA